MTDQRIDAMTTAEVLTELVVEATIDERAREDQEMEAMASRQHARMAARWMH